MESQIKIRRVPGSTAISKVIWYVVVRSVGNGQKVSESAAVLVPHMTEVRYHSVQIQPPQRFQ